MSFERTLRSNPTDAERRLWQSLRRKRFNGHRFRRQHRLGRYIVDFICLEAKLVVEVDGNQHAEQVAYDQVRGAWLESEGFRVIRFSDREVLTELVSVEQAIEVVLGASPPPQPSPLKGEGARVPRGGHHKGSDGERR